ncbi:MAG: acyltransferase [Alphaproteobacteria bacterium]|nr:acyltransferase [Alphaproteobacteria bacterium]
MTYLPAQRLPGLEGLRALAILLVFLRHNAYFFLEMQGKEPAQSPLWNLMLNGWIGVDLFFVLSGYLITVSLLRTHRHDWKTYAQKRFLRIVPAYVGVLALCVLGAFPFYVVPAEDLSWRVFYHLIFLQDYLPANINVVFWSLGVEEKFYIVAPFLILFLAGGSKEMAPRRLIFWVVGLIAVGGALRLLSFLVADPQNYAAFFENVRAPFHANWETLLLGVAIAFWRERKGALLPAQARNVFYAGLAGMTLLMASHEMMHTVGLFDALLQPLLVAACMALLVFSVVAGYSNRLLDNGAARYLSRISYSFYLVHFPLAPAVLYLWSIWGAGAFWVYSAAYLCISLLAATALHFALEKPFLDMKDRLAVRAAPKGA